MITTIRLDHIAASARQCLRHVRAVARRRFPSLFGFSHLVAPRVVLHVLVGALTLVSAQALFETFVHAWDDMVVTTVVYAEQQGPGSAVVSAPALSTALTAPTQPSQAIDRGGVLTDLGSSIGRGATATTVWRGIAGQEVNRRSAPNRSKPPVGTLAAGTPVEVVDWVAGEQVEPRNDTWAELSDGTFVFSTSLRRTGEVEAPAMPADAPKTGRWVDVNLTQQIATAYDGTKAVRTALISTGQPGWDTPVGVFPVLRRLEKDTMDGATLVGQGPNGAGADYKVENVRYVQYFTNDGAAIHENYWRRPATFGMPGSHGCIGMVPADAAWFWDFATIGTPLVIHE
jgi:lipoprotein-anchoring transpeptidase ErfK/SrfK